MMIFLHRLVVSDSSEQNSDSVCLNNEGWFKSRNFLISQTEKPKTDKLEVRWLRGLSPGPLPYLIIFKNYKYTCPTKLSQIKIILLLILKILKPQKQMENTHRVCHKLNSFFSKKGFHSGKENQFFECNRQTDQFVIELLFKESSQCHIIQV